MLMSAASCRFKCQAVQFLPQPAHESCPRVASTEPEPNSHDIFSITVTFKGLLMKTILLGTTALLVLGLGTAPARAELEVIVGGFVAFQVAAFDNDTANSTNRDFQSESELAVEAAAIAENGLEYGAYVQIESSTNDSANAGKTFVYLGGEGGKVELGDMIGAGSMAIGAPTVGVGQINGSYLRANG